MRVTLAGPADVALLARLLDADAGAVAAGTGSPVIPYLATELAHMGHQVTAVTLSREVHRPARHRIGPVDIVIGPFRRRHYGRDALRKERNTVRELLTSLDTDIVHAHWTYEFALGALATQHPVLVTVHDWAPAILRQSRDPYRAMRLGMQAVCLARARHLTGVSPYIGRHLSRFVPRPAALVPNSVHADFYVPAPRLATGTGYRILSVNSDFGPRKNCTSLITAFAIARAQLPHVELTLVGRDYHPGGAAEAWARARGLSDGIVFAGPVKAERVPAFMDSADLFVTPSLEESFGMTVLEAMARGLPVVGGVRSGAVPWLLDEGRAGVLVEVQNPKDISRAIAELVRNPDRRTRLGQAALERARQFTSAASAAGYVEQYERVLREESRRVR